MASGGILVALAESELGRDEQRTGVRASVALADVGEQRLRGATAFVHPSGVLPERAQ